MAKTGDNATVLCSAPCKTMLRSREALNWPPDVCTKAPSFSQHDKHPTQLPTGYFLHPYSQLAMPADPNSGASAPPQLSLSRPDRQTPHPLLYIQGTAHRSDHTPPHNQLARQSVGQPVQIFLTIRLYTRYIRFKSYRNTIRGHRAPKAIPMATEQMQPQFGKKKLLRYRCARTYQRIITIQLHSLPAYHDRRPTHNPRRRPDAKLHGTARDIFNKLKGQYGPGTSSGK
ncbi:hypothetical protein C8Q79DRAFT_766872 [Trametes meyenii]|nr:hypothetical protein C8Q79DRAFT_766872 [Trametes meyenii]